MRTIGFVFKFSLMFVWLLALTWMDRQQLGIVCLTLGFCGLVIWLFDKEFTCEEGSRNVGQEEARDSGRTEEDRLGYVEQGGWDEGCQEETGRVSGVVGFSGHCLDETSGEVDPIWKELGEIYGAKSN